MVLKNNESSSVLQETSLQPILLKQTVTKLQHLFLDELSRGNKTGRHLRVRLEALGWTGKRVAFQRIIRKLREAGLIRATRIPREEGEYRGSQSLYQLTESGWDAVIDIRDSYERSMNASRGVSHRYNG